MRLGTPSQRLQDIRALLDAAMALGSEYEEEARARYSLARACKACGQDAGALRLMHEAEKMFGEGHLEDAAKATEFARRWSQDEASGAVTNDAETEERGLARRRVSTEKTAKRGCCMRTMLATLGLGFIDAALTGGATAPAMLMGVHGSGLASSMAGNLATDLFQAILTGALANGLSTAGRGSTRATCYSLP